MTYVNGAPDPSDARAYAPGGLVGHDTEVDLERQRQQLKFMREFHNPHQRPGGFQSQPRPVFQLPRGPVYWNPTPASNAGPAPVTRNHYQTTTTTKRQEDEDRHERVRQQQQKHRAAPGHVAPSIHTILEIATMSSHRPSPTTQSSSPSSSVSASALTTKNKSPESPVKQSSHRAGTIGGQHQQLQLRHEEDQERHEVGRQSPPTISNATVAPSSLPLLSTGSVFDGSGMPLRRGKWTKAEEEFAAATIQYFCSGLLNLQFGTLLRGFLAQQLHCHPMRISKKLLPGTTFCGVEISRKLGRRAYSPRWCDSPAATQQKLDAEDHLAALRAKFIASIEEEADDLLEDTGSTRSKSSPSGRQDVRLSSEASDDGQSRASTTAGSPHNSDVRGEAIPRVRVTSPAVPLQQQQQQVYHQYQQQDSQQVDGIKRPREQHEQWAAPEQRHYGPHSQKHQQHQPMYQPSHQQQQQQHPYYSQRSYAAASTTSDERREASPPAVPQSSSTPPQRNWYPAPAPPPLPPSAGSHGLSQASFYYENVHRAVKLPRLSYNPQQPSYAEPKPRASVTPSTSSSNSPPLLPSLRASLERASSYRDQQQQHHQR